MPITTAQKARLKKLGNRVKELRNERGMTLKDLAHVLGKDPQSIHRLEMGGVNPSYLYLEEICKGLQIELNKLFD